MSSNMYNYVTFCGDNMTFDFLSLCSVDQNLNPEDYQTSTS